MARITIDDCIARIPNRFEMTLAATARARQLSQGATPLVEPNRDKNTVIALREIASGKIGAEVLKRNAAASAALGIAPPPVPGADGKPAGAAIAPSNPLSLWSSVAQA